MMREVGRRRRSDAKSKYIYLSAELTGDAIIITWRK